MFPEYNQQKYFSKESKSKKCSRFYIEGYQEINVGTNDLGTKVLLSSKVYIIMS